VACVRAAAAGDDAINAGRGFDGGLADLCAEFGKGLLGRAGVERHLAAEEISCSQEAEHEIGVGHGGLASAPAVADRPGLGTGAGRPHLEQAKGIDAGDAATAGADLDEVDRRHCDRHAAALLETIAAVDLLLAADDRPPVLDQAGFCGRAAHVERHELRQAEPGRKMCGRESACGRPALDHAHRIAAGDFGADDATRTEHDERRVGEPVGV